LSVSHSSSASVAPEASLFAKLRRMDRDELLGRSAQEVQKRLDDLRAVVGLPPRQPRRGTTTPAGVFFVPHAQIGAIVQAIQSHLPQQATSLVSRAEKICSHKFDLLGYRDLDFGDPIDWSLDPVSGRRASNAPWRRVPYLDYDKVGDHKVPWELSRHQHLTVLVRAWRLSGRDEFLFEAIDQFRDWRRQNPYPRGIHWTSALEVGFRTLSWLWLYQLVDGGDSRQKDFREELEAAIGHSAAYLERFLSTYFSPNTHLLGEALALYAAGSVCRSFEASARWRELGRSILIAEAKKQVLPEGAYFEQSTYYHVYALDMYLHFLALAEANRDSLPQDLRPLVERMAEWLWRLSAGGLPPRFGDDDGGRLFDGARNQPADLLDPLSTAAVLFRRPEFKGACGALREETLWLLGPDAAKRFDSLPASDATPSSKRQDDSGFHLLTAAGQPASAVTVDAGPLGALSGGHGHADALSLQWVRGGRYVLLDPGTGRYPHQTRERNQLRGAAAHSTVCLDELSQAEPSGSFGWEALPQSTTERFAAGRVLDLVVASHAGYERFSPPATHRRWVIFWKHGRLIVRDRIEGAGRRNAAISWRVGPEFAIESLSPDEVAFRTADGERLRLVAPRNPLWSREIFADDWSPCYGRLEAAPTVRFAAAMELPGEWLTALECESAEAEPDAESIQTLQDGRGRELTAYADHRAGSKAILCFADGAQRWKLGPLDSDARFLAFETGPGEPRLMAAGVSRIAWGGKPLLEIAGAPLDQLEWTSSAGIEASSALPASHRAAKGLEKIDIAELLGAATVSC